MKRATEKKNSTKKLSWTPKPKPEFWGKNKEMPGVKESENPYGNWTGF